MTEDNSSDKTSPPTNFSAGTAANSIPRAPEIDPKTKDQILGMIEGFRERYRTTGATPRYQRYREEDRKRREEGREDYNAERREEYQRGRKAAGRDPRRNVTGLDADARAARDDLQNKVRVWRHAKRKAGWSDAKIESELPAYLAKAEERAQRKGRSTKTASPAPAPAVVADEHDEELRELEAVIAALDEAEEKADD